MPSVFLYSYQENSEGAKVLADALGIKRIKHTNSKFTPSPNKTIINWGASEVPYNPEVVPIINDEYYVKQTANKLHFFRAMDVPNGPRIPRFTVNVDVAVSWLSDGYDVCARRILSGHSGNGLSIIHRNNIDTFVMAPLYTQYVKKKDEYRVHFAFGEIIDQQKKALRVTNADGTPADTSNINWKIRNLANGFVFIRNGFDLPPDVVDQAKKTIALTGLDFGAIDIIYNQKEQQAYVLEINTAPGLCGETIQSYANAFKEKLNI